jgi:RHS repeat-associated protein
MTDTPTVTATGTETPTPTTLPTGAVTIPYGYDVDYTYDPLYRLTAADYSTGEYYHYAYDPVGNRLSQQTHFGTTNYTYDNANRLTQVGAITYTWDDNGNLLSDGTNTYTYNHADQLTSVGGSTYTVSYAYNGFGDRLRQNVNGGTTTFVMDVNSGLTQALSDGTNTYLYGVDRIAQAGGSGTEYFLGDALGSVRQMADVPKGDAISGAVVLAQAYDPYGVTAYASGGSQSAYGFTGEYTSAAAGLIYLRARFYMADSGRFLSRDEWGGNANRPMSYDFWGYAYGNPINLTDPSGHDPWWCDDQPTPDAVRKCYVDWVKAHQGNQNPPPTPSPTLSPTSTPAPTIPNPASSIPSYPDDTGHENPAQDIEYTEGSGRWYYNLCGQVSAEIIIEALSGGPFDLHILMNLYNTWHCDAGGCGDVGLGNWELGELLAQSIGNRAKIIGYYGMAIYHYTGDWNEDYKNGITKLSHNWEAGLDIRNTMAGWLRDGNFLIVGGVLNQFRVSGDNPDGLRMVGDHMPENRAGAQYIRHWVVIRSINGDDITIVNPFYNRIEHYSWSNVFQDSMRNDGNSLICIVPNKTGTCDLPK